MPKYLAAAILLQVVAYVAFISLGLPDTVNGVAWPSVRDEFGRHNSALGIITVLSTAGYLASSNFTPWLLARVSVGMLLFASTALVAAGLTGYAVAPVWLLFASAALLNGAGSGAIDTSLNAYAARHFSLRSMNWLHGFYMVGAGMGPAIMTGIITQGISWRTGYGVLAGILSVLALVFLSTRKMWGNGGENAERRVEVAEDATTGLRGSVFRSRPILLQASLFFLQSAMEAGAGLWCFTYLVEERGMSAGAAGSLTTFYWVVFGFGRFSLGAVSHYVGAVSLVRLGSLLAVAGAVVFAFVPANLTWLGLMGIGLGLAPVFPTLMSCTPERAGSDLANRAVGLQVSCSAVGVATMPAMMGLMASFFGLPVIPWLLLANGIVLVAVHEVLVRAGRDPHV